MAVYKRRKWRINGPYVNTIIFNITLKAAEPLVATFLKKNFTETWGPPKSLKFVLVTQSNSPITITQVGIIMLVEKSLLSKIRGGEELKALCHISAAATYNNQLFYF